MNRFLIIEKFNAFADLLANAIRLEPNFLCANEPVIYNKTSDLFELIEAHDINFVLLNHNIEGNENGRAIQLIRSKYPRLMLLVYSMYHHHQDFRDALKNRADGFILLTSPWEEFKESIQRVLAGEIVMGTGVTLGNASKKDSSALPKNQSLDKVVVLNELTKRELEILSHISEAKSNKIIANILFISDKTVIVHRKNLMRKLNVTSVVALLKKAREIGLVV